MSATARSWSFLCLASVLFAGCASSAHKSPTLIQVIQAAGQSNTRLRPPWIGQAEVTLRTGQLTAEPGPQSYKLSFDWFIYPYKSYWQTTDSTIICQSSDGQHLRDVYTWRPSLPTDQELTNATTGSALDAVLGPSQGTIDSWASEGKKRSTEDWQFFQVIDAGTIRTLSVFCAVTWQSAYKDRHIDGLLVVRGIARPQ